MFKRILVWLRGVLNKMLTKTNIKDALQVDIAISKPMIDALSLWVKMYENDAPWLLNKDIKSLNLPAAIASEIAKSVTIEMEVKIEGSPRADYLAEQFKWVQEKLREKCEFMLAKGGLVFKPYLEGDQILVDYIQADQFFPIEGISYIRLDRIDEIRIMCGRRLHFKCKDVNNKYYALLDINDEASLVEYIEENQI